MLYLAIDQHAKQLTVSMRNEAGKVVLRRQVSTQPNKVRSFFSEVQQWSQAEEGFIAVVEVCGFNDWLIALLTEYGCRETVLIQPEKASKKKTDRRDANQLGELLWVNRHRLAGGEKIQGVRRICLVSEEDLADRRLTAARQRMSHQRTRVINKIKQILRRHNLQWEFPTKTFATKQALRWLEEVALPPLDRLEMNHLLAAWQLYSQQLLELDEWVIKRCQNNWLALLLTTVPGVNAFIALALFCRINTIDRFPSPRSLGNYWGLTPSCRNSGEKSDRLGSITKQGSKIARALLAQAVVHILRRDGQINTWYKRLRQRRGSKIARVATMRRLTTIIWHMLKDRRPYQCRGTANMSTRKQQARKKWIEKFAAAKAAAPGADRPATRKSRLPAAERNGAAAKAAAPGADRPATTKTSRLPAAERDGAAAKAAAPGADRPVRKKSRRRTAERNGAAAKAAAP